MRLWLLSNGRGEDRAAALVGSELVKLRPELRLAGAALVTGGEDFVTRGIEPRITGRVPPSGGFPHTNLRAFLGDLPASPCYLAFVRRLRRLIELDDQFAAFGDVFLTGLAWFAFRRPGVHAALAKSTHGRPHSRVECRLLRRWTRLVFARDAATSADLERRGVRAVFVGNPLVDGFVPASAEQWPLPSDRRSDEPLVLLLPGSRREAPANLVKLLEVVTCLADPARWVCAWPGAVGVESAAQAATAAGWRPVNGRISRENRDVALVGGRFESLLHAADLVIGLAGSANEQAAALGKPVVTFVGAGAQTTAGRMQEQERLLGGAAVFVRGTAKDVAAAVSRLLQSPEERSRRGAAGIARLGPAGGAARVAARTIAEFGL